MRTYRILLDPESGEGIPSTTPAATVGGSPEAQAEFHKQLAKHNGDMGALAGQLFAQVLTERRTAAKYRASVPAEGSVVLAGDEAKAWQAIQSIGADEIKRRVREYPDLSVKVAASERRDRLSEVGEKAGVTNPKAFFRIAGDAEFEVKKEPKDGKDIEVVYVKDGDALVPFDDAFADFLPAIKADAPRGESVPTGMGTPRRDAASARPAPGPARPDGRAGERDLTPQEQLLKSGRYIGATRR